MELDTIAQPQAPVANDDGALRAHPRTHRPALKSFWLGGFESACHINSRRERIDMLAATQHDRHCENDYRMLHDLGILTVRDGIRWHLIDKDGRFDFSSFIPMAKAARKVGTQVIWNICHYGWPDDLDIFSPKFVTRFGQFCSAVASVAGEYCDEVPWYCPINEISYMAWAIGHKGTMHPFELGRAGELKRQLIRAAIEGMECIWSVDPRARFVHVDPIIQVFPPRGRPELVAAAAAQHAAQFDAWDMISGRSHPELGGSPKYLDAVGVNYYHSNQFEHPDIRLRWEDEPRDPRWIPLHELLARVQKRYHRPLILAETSHFGAGRARWMEEIGRELCAAHARPVDIIGACLYPIIDRPDWENADHWHNSGLFDLRRDESGFLARVPHAPYVEALRAAQKFIASGGTISGRAMA